MKRYRLIVLSLVLVFALAALLPACAGADASTITVRVEGLFGQTAARSMLETINEFRQGDEAWYFDRDDTTHISCPGLSALEYDYELEQIAIQRAIEIALSFDHTRPDGSDCWTAYTVSGYTAKGENIAAGSTTAAGAFNQWKEDGKPFSGQGHRRNMLEAKFNRIGIGHVIVNNVHYWVQELGKTTNTTTQTAALDSTAVKEVSVDVTRITSMTADPVELTFGENVNIPGVGLQLVEIWPGNSVVHAEIPGLNWTSAAPDYIGIEEGKIVGLAAGSGNLTATVGTNNLSSAVTVNPKDLSDAAVTLTGSFTYNGLSQTPAVTVKDGSTKLTEDADYTVSYANNRNVTEQATVTVTGKGNYTGETGTTFAIGKAPLTVTANSKVISYGEEPVNAGVTYSGFVNSETDAVLGGTLAYSYNYNQYDNVGAYTITPSGLTSGNYEITFEPGALTVSGKTVGLSWDDTALTYSGKAQAPTVTVTGTVNNDAVEAAVDGAQTNAGRYTATVTGLTGDKAGNYSLPAAVTKDFDINKAALTVKANDKSLTYGDAPETAGMTYSGFVNGETENMLSGTLNLSCSYTQYGKVGTYPITPSGLTSGNYEISFSDGTLTVAEKEVGLTWNGTSLTYNGTPQAPTVTVTGTVNNDVIGATVSGAQTNAGSYTATVTGLTGDNTVNYCLPADKATGFVIGKITLQVKANDHTITYGDAPAGAGVTCDGFVNNETEAVLGGTLAYGFDYNQYDDVGSYTITPSGLTSGNYEITFEPGALTVSEKPVSLSWDDTALTYSGKAQAPTVTVTGTVNNDAVEAAVDGAQTNAGRYTATVTGLTGDKAGNYFLPAAATKDFDINKAALTVKANDKSVTYGDAPQTAGVTFSGFVNGETENTLSGTLSLSCSYTQYGDAGTYPIIPSGLTAGNYEISFSEGTLTVAEKEVGLTWSGTSLTYNGTLQAPTAAVTGTVNNDAIDATVNGAQTNAGSYTAIVIDLTGDNAANYRLPADATSRFVIGKITLQVKANDHAITYGDAPAGAGITCDGFVNNETETVLGGTLKYSYNYSQYGDVGSYTITPSGLTSGNYEITFEPGALTVSKKMVGLSWDDTALTYSGNDQAPAVTVTGTVNNDAVEAAVDGAQTDVGHYTATVTGLAGDKADNYSLPAAVTTDFEIQQAFPTVIAPVAIDNLVFTGEAQELITAGSAVGGTMVYSLSEDGTYTEAIPAAAEIGTYNVWYKAIALNDNYKDTEAASVQVTIAAKPDEPPGQPGGNPGENPGGQPGENPGENPGEQPGENPGENPGEQPGENPGETPGEQPGEQPEEDPTAPTVSGLKYKLNLTKKTATVTGPADKNLKKIVIPATISTGGVKYKVTEVGKAAFKDCIKATEITIGSNVEKIGKQAFDGCRQAKKVNIKTKKLIKKKVGANAFRNLKKGVTVKCPKKVLEDYRSFLPKKGMPKTAKYTK